VTAASSCPVSLGGNTLSILGTSVVTLNGPLSGTGSANVLVNSSANLILSNVANATGFQGSTTILSGALESVAGNGCAGDHRPDLPAPGSTLSLLGAYSVAPPIITVADIGSVAQINSLGGSLAGTITVNTPITITAQGSGLTTGLSGSLVSHAGLGATYLMTLNGRATSISVSRAASAASSRST